jgi:lipoprotein LpqH
MLTTKSLLTKTVATAAAAACCIAALSGCSSSSKGKASTSNNTSSAAGSTQAAGGGSSSGGGSSASINGKAISANYTTTCANQGGTLALALADPSNATYGTLGVSATVTNKTTVSAVAFGGTKGGSNGTAFALAYAPGTPTASASVSNSGNTYTVSGKTTYVDNAHPTSPTTENFKIVFACGTIVGG